MRSDVRLCVGLALLGVSLSAGSQQTSTPPPASPPTAETSPVTAPARSAAGAVAGSQLVTEQPAADSKSKKKGSHQETDQEPASNTTRKLPPEVDPNPPKAEDLAAAGQTWRGEYEADKDGKVILGSDARPVPVIYNSKGKRLKAKFKVPKTHPIAIVNGTLTVDGWAGKAQLNYDIADLKFIYLSAPGVGTLIISQTAFPGSSEQKEAFSGKTLTVKAGEHELQLASDKPFVGKNSESAYVHFDPSFTQDPRYPVMGYGDRAGAPYEWPGAKPVEAKGVAKDAPPLPASMRPRLAAAPVCIAQPGHPCSAAGKKPAEAPAPAETMVPAAPVQ